MLLVQYLYAAFSLKSGGAFMALTDDQKAAVRAWQLKLTEIAVEEMGHLMTVQNLRRFLRAGPVFDREEFPPKADVYPFQLHLEPLTPSSLSKYVIAEAPVDAPLDEYRARVKGQETVHHVGVIYGVLAVLFSSPGTLPPAGDPDAWQDFVGRVAAAIEAGKDPESWHVPEALMDPASIERQADPAHFYSSREGFHIHRIATSADARAAIRDIGLQGEAPVAVEGVLSHYARFRGMAEGTKGVIPFPMAKEFEPSFAVPVDPKLADYAEPALSKALECNAAYTAMIGALRDYLDAGTGDERTAHADAAVDLMRDVKRIAKDLMKLEQRPGSGVVAAPPFTPPA
jgi:hypothetical protein